MLLQLHVALSLIGILTGLVVLFDLLQGRLRSSWTAVFLATTVLTSVTGFPLPPFGFDPPRAVGVLSLVLLALALACLYVFHLAGIWRRVYVITAIAALYLNVFVAVAQSFQKIPALNALAPTQSEPPFAVAQVVVLAIFVVLGWRAVRAFNGAPALQPAG